MSQTSFAQSVDTVYYGIDGIVGSNDSAFYVRYFNYDSSSNRYKYKQWSLIKISHGYEGSGELKSINPEIKDGGFEEFDHLGNYVTYLYKDNKFIDIINYEDAEGNPVQPVYPIGLIDSTFYKDQFILDHIEKTSDSLKGRNSLDIMNSCKLAIVEFVIEVDGSPANVRMIKGCYNILDNQVIEIIKQKKFKPISYNGIDVRTLVAIPIIIKE